MIVHTCFIEHVTNLNDFISNIGKYLKKGGRMIFSMPEMDYMIYEKFISIMNFEHTFMCTEYYVDTLLEKAGFVIHEKIHFGHGHTTIYDTEYVGKCKKVSFPIEIYDKNKKMFLEYVAYGFGLQIEKIQALLDNSIYKQGKKVSGIDKEIISPKQLKGDESIVIIIPNSPYREEIKKDIKENVNSNVEFWE